MSTALKSFTSSANAPSTASLTSLLATEVTFIVVPSGKVPAGATTLTFTELALPTKVFASVLSFVSSLAFSFSGASVTSSAGSSAGAASSPDSGSVASSAG